VRQALATEQAARNSGTVEEVQRLVNSRNLRDPNALRRFLDKVQREQRQGQQGALQQLRDAAARAASGSEVYLENMPNPQNPQEPYGADVLDATRREAIQHKAVTGNTPPQGNDPVYNNMRDAIQQLQGAGGENPIYARISCKS